MKTLVCTFATNNKFPITLQYAQFNKYMKNQFEFILFNDAYNEHETTKLQQIAEDLKITCVRVPQNIHHNNNASECYARTLNWAVKTYLSTVQEIVLLVHSDVFPVADIYVADIIQDNHIATTYEIRQGSEGKVVTYFYPALTFINMKTADIKLLDFNCRLGRGSTCETVGLDTGGLTHTYFEKYKCNVKLLEAIQISNKNYFPENEDLNSYFSQIYDICRKYELSSGWYAVGFYHYIAGSQWDAPVGAIKRQEGHQKKLNTCCDFFLQKI